MITQKQIEEMYHKARQEFLYVKQEHMKAFITDKSNYSLADREIASENLNYRTTQLKLLEVILQIPSVDRILNDNPVLGQSFEKEVDIPEFMKAGVK
jgi:hypothetical protein